MYLALGGCWIDLGRRMSNRQITSCGIVWNVCRLRRSAPTRYYSALQIDLIGSGSLLSVCFELVCQAEASSEQSRIGSQSRLLLALAERFDPFLLYRHYHLHRPS